MTSEQSEENFPSCKIVVVGDGAVGKTCLLIRYTSDTFPTDYVPTVFDNYTEYKDIEYELKSKNKSNKKIKTKVRIDLWDTAGQEEFDRIRPLSYRDASYFLVCFSVNSPDSFDHVMDKWVPEIRHFAPHKRFLLVGLQCDLRTDQREISNFNEFRRKSVSINTINETIEEIGADGYVECSALKKLNINKVFETAMKNYLSHTKEPKVAKQCSIM